MSDTLLATKIHIPLLRTNLVNRQTLIQRLNDGISQNHRLALISAPAGYGKSTLLSEWASQAVIPVTWLSLEKGENAPERFWSYFITALSNVSHLSQAGICDSILRSLQTPQPPPMQELLTELINGLDKLEHGAVLILDDFHCIIESQIHRDLVFLIDHFPISPHGLHLIVASRMDPPWPLARWRARGELTELRSADLRFSFDEAVKLLNQIQQLKLSEPDIGMVQKKTEGWIVGLQMVALSIQGLLNTQGSNAVSQFIESFTGSNRFILDYLVDEVISQQTSELRDFLYDTSVLEQFTAPLCDAILGRKDSHAILSQLEQANLFLIPLDDDRQWFRYHHLFAELLRKRVKEAQPNHIAELHQRASRWYAQNNFLSEAISHALNAGDFPLVNDLVSENAFAIVERTELLDVLRHFEELADGQIVSRPWLGVSYAWVKTSADPSGDVEHILEKIGRGMADIENSSERERIGSHIDAVRAYVAWLKGDADQVLVLVHRAMQSLPEKDFWTRATLFRLEGLAYQSLYNLPASIQSYEAGVITGPNSREFSDHLIYSILAIARVRFLQGRLQQTLSDCQRVLSLVNESGQILKPSVAHAYVCMSNVQLEFNNLEAATLLARQGVSLAEQWKQAETLWVALNCLSSALCAAGNLEEASAIIQRNKQLAQHISPLFIHYAAWDEIRLNILKGNISAAEQMFVEVESMGTQEDKIGWFLLTKANLIYAQERYEDVLSVLDEPVRDLEQKGVYSHLMKLMSIQALALNALGRREEALSSITHCLDLAEPEGYVRIFVERGAPMLVLLQLADRRGIHSGYIGKLLPAFREGRTLQKSTRDQIRIKDQSHTLIEPLSERELQVLRLLQSAMTSDDISRELFISVNTARTHIRNIYGKLAVHGRIEAIQKARELHLI